MGLMSWDTCHRTHIMGHMSWDSYHRTHIMGDMPLGLISWDSCHGIHFTDIHIIPIDNVFKLSNQDIITCKLSNHEPVFSTRLMSWTPLSDYDKV